MPKKNRPKKTVNVDAVKKEVNKMAKEIAKSAPNEHGHVELDPGTSKRQSPLEQDMGSRKYREMIHDHNDKNKHILDRLPFTFPKKKMIRSSQTVVVECVECGYQHVGNEHTYGITCPDCKAYRRVKNPEAESRGQAPPENDDERVGMFGTASDLLELREKRRLAEEARKRANRLAKFGKTGYN